MKKNIGTPDRLLRAFFGVVLLALAWTYSSWILLAAAVFTFYEAFASWCLFYQIIGKSTCPLDKQK
jgi:hypothetical protein